MDPKIKKGLRLAAAAIFVFALALNIKITLDDPFMMMSDKAVASTTYNSSSGGGSSSCDVIVTPNGNGTEGAILVELICSEHPIILKMEAYCSWTGNCDDICMFDDEHDCE